MIENDALIIETGHARLRMSQRGINTEDIIYILKNPTYIKKVSESAVIADRYNYRVVGKFDWSVVVSIDYPSKLIIVTVID
ncbi:DUF4258 domain-containing protein [Paenibacillus yanchengensis]